IVSKTLFSTALNEAEFETVAEVMRPMLRFATRRITSPFDFMDDWPTPANLRNRQRQEKLNQIVYRIIRERRSTNQTHDDLLGMLMGARDEETGAGMDDRQLRDEVMTIFLAGHETTANLLSFLWALLAEYAAVRRQLQQELDQQLRGRAPTVDDIPALTLTNLVIQETLRLYPPAWIIGRQSVEADNIAGYTIPPHTGVLISPYIIHRHTGYWRNPEGFDPWRFTEERSQDRPRYAFLPFGGGPRLCIGNNFALTEAALVVATIAQRYDLDLAPDRHAEVEAAFTLRPKNGVWMTLHERKNHRSGA
ncbi:MAG TPA: cytochrome P450, partial [Candidatus Binatia bacterium]|nr:cytochrome P450 [Candidatus Binatia bacterium]